MAEVWWGRLQVVAGIGLILASVVILTALIVLVVTVLHYVTALRKFEESKTYTENYFCARHMMERCNKIAHFFLNILIAAAVAFLVCLIVLLYSIGTLS